MRVDWQPHGLRSSPEFKHLQAELGARLRELRTQKGMTQEQAAGAIGYAPRHLQKVEAGEVNLTLLTLHRFALVYGFDVRELFGG